MKSKQQILHEYQEVARRQREALEKMDLTDEEVERAMGPLLSYIAGLEEEA